MWRRVKYELGQGRTLIQFGLLKAFGQGLGMVAPLVVAKYLSRELFGSYSLAKMIVFFFTTLLIASSQNPFIVLANQEKARSGKINKVFSVQCSFLGLSILGFALIALLGGRYITAFARITTAELSFAFLAFLGLALKSFLCNLFMALDQRIKSSIAELLFGGLTLALVLGFYATGTINLKTVFSAYLVSAVLTILALVKFIDHDQLLPFALERQCFKEMFDFTKWIAVGAATAYFINWGDNLVLRAYVSMGDIGDYNLAYQLFKGVAMLILIIPAYFLPFVSRHIQDRDKIRGYLYKKRPKILVLGLVVIAVIFFVVPAAFKLVYGQSYAGSIAVLRILFAASVVILYVVFYEALLYALKRYKYLQVVNLCQVVLNLALDLILVPRMGMAGAATATAFAYLCRTVTMEIYYRIRLKKLWQP